jgi:hypothetical protein
VLAVLIINDLRQIQLSSSIRCGPFCSAKGGFNPLARSRRAATPKLAIHGRLPFEKADTNSQGILLRRLDEKVRQPRGNDVWYLGTQLTPETADIVFGRGDVRALASISTPLILRRLENEWRDMPLNIVGGAGSICLGSAKL